MSQKVTEEVQSKQLILIGVLCALGAVCIWAGWMAITRLGVTTSLTSPDITMLRFGGAGILLAPILFRRGLALDKLGGFKSVVLVVGAGAPYALVAATGLLYAPAAHAGVLIPGIMPLFVALLSLFILKENFCRQRKIGYGFILLGLFTIVGISSLSLNDGQILGHIMFLTASFMWASYTIVLRVSGIAPLHAVAIISVGSLVIYTPIYFSIYGLKFLDAPVTEIVYQALFQGVISTILAFYLFGKAVSILGASFSASFGALVPGIAAIIAIPILGEYPNVLDCIGIVIVTVGVYLANGRRMHFIK